MENFLTKDLKVKGRSLWYNKLIENLKNTFNIEIKMRYL